MPYHNSFDGRASTYLSNITWDDTISVNGPSELHLDYDNPDIEVNGSARFATHEIVGGTTVRQKIGQDPLEISMDGVCKERTAAKIDFLRATELVTLNSDRLMNSVRCQVASTSTTPLSPGGAADADSGEFLYEYSVNLVEITPPSQ